MAPYVSCVSRLARKFSNDFFSLKANKRKKKATMLMSLVVILPFYSPVSLLILTSFLPCGIFVCHELIELTEWNLNGHICPKY